MKSEFIPLLSLCIEDRRIVEGGSAEARRLSYLSLEHVEAQTGRLLKEPEDAVADEGKSTTFYYDERHVLYGKLRPYLNKVALPDQPGRCTTEIIPLLPTPGTSREYLSYLLRRPEAVELAMRDTTGSRMPRASMKELMKMMVPKHGPNEQNRIAGLLTGQLAAVEKARKAAAERVAAAGRLEAKLLLDAFHGIVPVALDSDEVGERKGWSWKLITKLARLESGHTPSRNHPEWWHGDVEWLQLSDVRRLDGEVAMRSGERTNELGLANSAARLLPKGTVCLSRTASVASPPSWGVKWLPVRTSRTGCAANNWTLAT
ncbi:MAG: hypothetical protein IPI41_04050 [Flavobacteriales bacterium]|nr:hypothetical protein [Flavobacteriales bacterium]